jgi:hypothetical protein
MEPAIRAQAPSQPGSNSLSVQEMLVVTDIEKLKPIGVAESFPATVGKLFCFTKITGARTGTLVRHLWFYGDRLMSMVSLPVKQTSWRTYSLQSIQPRWTGAWRVDVTAEDGTLLKSVSFTIE